MSELLPKNEIGDSFRAVLFFLRDGGYLDNITHRLECTIHTSHPHSFNDMIEFECNDQYTNESYVLRSDAFKSFGYHRPVWSSYHPFSYNQKKGELSVTLEDVKYQIRRRI